MNFPSRETVEKLRSTYPVGCRIVLDSMDDPYVHIPVGEQATVTGVDDAGKAMAVSPDPMLPMLTEALTGVTPGDPASADGRLDDILANANLFGVSLVEAGLKDKVAALFREELAGPGAVRATLARHLGD